MIEAEIAAFLVEQGLAEGVMEDIWFQDDPSTPDTCLILQTFAGPEPLYQPARPNYTQERPSLSLTVRDAGDRGAAQMRAESLLRAIGSIQNRYLSGVWYLSVRPAHSSPLSMPLDDHDRPSYTVNFNVMKNPSPIS